MKSLGQFYLGILTLVAFLVLMPVSFSNSQMALLLSFKCLSATSPFFGCILLVGYYTDFFLENKNWYLTIKEFSHGKLIFISLFSSEYPFNLFFRLSPWSVP